MYSCSQHSSIPFVTRLTPQNNIYQSHGLLGKYLEWIIAILSSVLLGIWAAKETIALRNILLVSETLLSIFYMANEFKHSNLKECCDFWRLLPFLFLVLALAWVVTHYLFFAIDPAQQLKELKSTWLRAFMASIVGLGTGLVFRSHPNRLNLLWLGIFVAFIVLFYQYTPRALQQGKLLVPDYDHYLFHLKINTVLMGLILLAGIDGAMFDHLRSIKFQWCYFRFSYLLFWLIGTVMVLWSFVFIVNARNGIGLSTTLYIFWFVCSLVIFIRGQIQRFNLRGWLFFLFAGAGLLLTLYFGFLQSKLNSGWTTLLADAKVAIQIDRYPNWQNPPKLGYPKRDDGQTVTSNTYERVAWATAGSRAILQYPVGVGVLAHPFAMHPKALENKQSTSGMLTIATHSGWVELGLAFGIPLVALIFAALITFFINAIRKDYPAKMTILGFCISILSLYTVGEVAIDHGLEILFFLLALLPALMLTSVTLLTKK